MNIYLLTNFYFIVSVDSAKENALMICLSLLNFDHLLLEIWVKLLLLPEKYKVFDRIWHKSLILKLPSYSLYSPIYSFISSFLSIHSIATMVDGHSSPKSINSCISQGLVLSPILFLMLMTLALLA